MSFERVEYEKLIDTSHLHCFEKSRNYFCLTERHLQAIWFEQKYFLTLQTHDGEPIQVISPGIWNVGSGPDFLKAHLVIGGRHIQGDIEIHLQESGWKTHGHARDCNYERVVLHVTLWPGCTTLYTTSGPIPYRTHLSHSLAVSTDQLAQLIDLDLYPYKKFLGSGRCAQQLFCHLPSEKIQSVFHSAALWRLKQKFQYLSLHTPHGKSPIQTGVAQALGFKKNSEAFLQLYKWLVSQKIKNKKELFCLGLASLGFFEEPYKLRWDGIAEYRLYSELFQALGQPDMPRFAIDNHQIRPANHPVRRLAALIAVILDTNYSGLEKDMLTLWKDLRHAFSHKKLYKQLLELIPDYHDDFWNEHYTFTARSKTLLPLIGESLKHEIVLNSIFPAIYSIIDTQAEMEDFLSLYASLPSSNTGKTRYLTHRYFGDTAKGLLLQKSIAEQGAYQVHRDFCVHFEASCEGCPFVSKVQSLLYTN